MTPPVHPRTWPSALIKDSACMRAEALALSGAAFIGLEADNPGRPEAANLLAIYSLVTGRSKVLPPSDRARPR